MVSMKGFLGQVHSNGSRVIKNNSKWDWTLSRPGCMYDDISRWGSLVTRHSCPACYKLLVGLEP
jgi:hypothetical protein